MNRSNLFEASSEPKYVSTATVATALGVSVTTVKRWVDDGHLLAHRTPGRHRKLLLQDVLRLIQDGKLPQADVSKLLPASSPDLADPEKLLSMILQLVRDQNAHAIAELLVKAHRAGMSVSTLADRIISPALTYVGEEWSQGNLHVHQEHLITQACVSALYEIKANLRHQSSGPHPVAFGGAPEHDHYILPSLFASLALLEVGWEAVNLGPHTPMFAFRQALDSIRPEFVWISISHIENEVSFAEEYRSFFREAESRNIPVALGGRALSDSVRSQLPYTTFGDGMNHLVSFAKSLHRNKDLPKRGRPVIDSSRE